MSHDHEPLLTWRGVLCGCAAVLLASLGFAIDLLRSLPSPTLGGLFNDFWDYWAAARILDMGGDPYDKQLVGHVLTGAGIDSTVGTGYSYPLLMAELARPLGLLPPRFAAVVFTVGSALAVGVATALLTSPHHRARAWQLALLTAAVGLFGPVTGSLYFGQVNLYVLAPLALAYRGVGAAGALAVAAAVKLYPGAIIVAFLGEGRRGVRRAVIALGLTIGLAVGPNVVTGRWSYGTSLLRMFGPDPYWSNQSINGLLSRLALPSSSTSPPLPGLPVTPVMLLACAVLGAVIVAILARRRHSWQDMFALLLCYSVIAAPKNSLWNFTPLAIAFLHGWSRLSQGPPVRDERVGVQVRQIVGWRRAPDRAGPSAREGGAQEPGREMVCLGAKAPSGTGGPWLFGRPGALASLASSWALVQLGLAWALVGASDAPTVAHMLFPGQPAATWLSSVPLYGGLLLLGILARMQLEERPVVEAPPRRVTDSLKSGDFGVQIPPIH